MFYAIFRECIQFFPYYYHHEKAYLFPSKVTTQSVILYLIILFSAEIIMLDGLTIVYRSSVDLYFYVMGSQYENEVSLNNKFNNLKFNSIEKKFQRSFQ